MKSNIVLKLRHLINNSHYLNQIHYMTKADFHVLVSITEPNINLQQYKYCNKTNVKCQMKMSKEKEMSLLKYFI